MAKPARSPAFAASRFSNACAFDAEDAGNARRSARTSGDGSALADLAAKHTRNRKLAAVAGVQRFHDIGDAVAISIELQPCRGLRDPRYFVPERFHQPQHAIFADRRADHDRADRTVAQFLRQIVENLVARRLDVFEQLLHQLVIVIGEPLQHGEARVFLTARIIAFKRDQFAGRMFAIDKRALQREIDEADHDAVVPDRDLP